MKTSMILMVLLLILVLAASCGTASPITTLSPTQPTSQTPVSSPTMPITTTQSASPSPISTPTVPAGPPPGAVSPDVVNSSNVTFPGAAGTIKAYQAWPKTSGPYPTLIVIHENRGLTEHIKDVTRRFANQGYLALGVDLLSRLGGREAFATDEEAVAGIGKLTSEGVIQDLNSAMAYLKGLPEVKKDSIGVIGYCWGGGNSLLFSTVSKDLQAAVVYYGPNPANIDDVANITVPVLGIYGADDARITVNVPALEEAMKKYNKSFEYKIYPGAAHGFFNDTGTRYNAEAAADAWAMTIAFLKRNLVD